VNPSRFTIVIPTRDRPQLLELCLRSVFERQTKIPNVIVSDNSVSAQPAVDVLRRKYGFGYVRQSGKMTMTDHFNACLRLPSTSWIMLLHDDDELYPESLAKVESLLGNANDVGMVVGGVQYIDPNGSLFGEWFPEANMTLRAEDALLKLGLGYLHARSPNTIFSVADSCDIGGFPDVNGVAGDYTFFCRLAYTYGVVFVPEHLGRYRLGHDQATNYSTPEKAEAHLQYCVQMASLLVSIGCSATVADRLIDEMTWGLFLFHAPWWQDSQPEFVSRLCQQCLRLSPQLGTWQERARKEYPFCF
jgi:hypothetical protein